MSGVKTLTQSFFLCLLLNVGHVDGTSSSSNTLKLSALRFYDPPLSDPDGMTMGLLQAAYIDTAQPTNVSNWLPICELSYTVSHSKCFYHYFYVILLLFSTLTNLLHFFLPNSAKSPLSDIIHSI